MNIVFLRRPALLSALFACMACGGNAGNPEGQASSPPSNGEVPAEPPPPTAEAPVSIGSAAPVGAINRAGVHAVATNGDTVVVLTELGVWRSADAGNTWQEVVVGPLASGDRLDALAFFDGKFFASTTDRVVFVSTDDGATFPSTSLVADADPTRFESRLRASHGELLGVFGGKPYRFGAGGWVAIPGPDLALVTEIETDGTFVYVSSDNGVQRTRLASATAESWEPVEALPGWAYRFSWVDEVGFAWNEDEGLKRTTDGTAWSVSADVATVGTIEAVSRDTNGGFVLASSLGVFRSADGLAWAKDSTSLAGVKAFATAGARTFAAGKGLYRSDRTTMVPVSLNLGRVTQLRGGDRPEALTSKGSMAWDAGTKTWLDVLTPGVSFETSDGARYAMTPETGDESGRFIVRDDGGTWKRVASAPVTIGTLDLLGATGKRLFITGSSWFGATCHNGNKGPALKANDTLSYSDNAGKTWHAVSGLKTVLLPCNDELGFEDFAWLKGDGALVVLAAAAPWTSIYVSHDGGATFEATTSGLPDDRNPDAALVVGDSATLAFGSQLFRLNQTGWTPVDTTGFPGEATIVSFARTEGCTAAAVEAKGDASGVYTSCDHDKSFRLATKVPSPSVLEYRTGSTDLLIGTNRQGVWRAPITRR
jgi:hypothetical protein